MLNTASAVLIQIAETRREDAELIDMPPDTLLLEVAEMEGSFIYDDIKLARIIVDELGWERALTTAEDYYPWPQARPAGEVLFDEYRAAWEDPHYTPEQTAIAQGHIDRALEIARERAANDEWTGLA